MLMSASTNDVLTIGERLFDNQPVTPAARANDTSDIFVVRGGRYLGEPARPFRTATLDHIQCGHVDCEPEERARGANLGLYSVTFNNGSTTTCATLEAVPPVPRRRPSARVFATSSKSSIPTRRKAVDADRSAAVHQRLDRPDAGRRRARPGGRSS